MDGDVTAALAWVLQDERRARGLSVSALSRAAKIPRRTLDRILRGEVDAKVSQVVDLALALGLHPGELSRRVWGRMGREHEP